MRTDMRSAVVLARVLAACAIPTAALAQETLGVDTRGRAAAGVVFADTPTDDEVRAVLQRYNVLPYTVYFGGAAAALHDVPVAQASLALIAEGRRRAMEGVGNWPCLLIARLRHMRESRRGVSAAPGERYSFDRLRLTEIERARSARERVLRGDFPVYGVKVVGDAADVRRLSTDPRVREFRPGQVVNSGGRQEFLVTGMAPPRESLPRTTPEVDSLSDAEVAERLQRLTSDPPAECRGVLRNVEGGERPERPESVPTRPGIYTAAGLLFRAEARLVPEQGTSPQSPDTQMSQTLRTFVTVTNPSQRRIETGIAGCTLRPRIYHAGPGGRPAWDQSRAIGCMQDPMRLALDPGESRTFEDRTDIWRILGDSLRAGRYAVAGVFRLADRALEIPAGEVELSLRLEGFTYRAETRLADTMLHARASATNVTRRPIYVEYGACALYLRAYRNPDRSGMPVWRSERRAPWGGNFGYACPSYLATGTVAPGATLQPREFELAVPLIEILGDSLPDGRYYFAAALRLNFGRTREVPAGSAMLALRRQPLPSSQRADAVVYSAATEVDRSSATIRTTVTVLLPSNPAGTRLGVQTAAIHRYARDCPVVLHAYRDRARRDATPRSGAPDWTSARDCGTEEQELVLRGDEPRRFEVSATAREILGGRLPPGRYYFAAAVRERNRTIYLSAGEADLTR